MKFHEKLWYVKAQINKQDGIFGMQSITQSSIIMNKLLLFHCLFNFSQKYLKGFGWHFTHTFLMHRPLLDNEYLGIQATNDVLQSTKTPTATATSKVNFSSSHNFFKHLHMQIVSNFRLYITVLYFFRLYAGFTVMHRFALIGVIMHSRCIFQASLDYDDDKSGM